MNNLRVNSKSTIAEFKRKHNWLVDNATIKLNVSNIKSLSNEDIESLNCGDVVLKEDASGKHAYLVTFRNDTGICLTYVDASVVETQSYDKVNNNWNYNSEDISHLPINGKMEGDLELDGNAKVSGKFEQGSYNWQSENLSLNNTWKNGLTAVNSFIKFVQINKTLYFIVSAVLKNETENAITTAASGSSIVGLVTLPESISSKIYRKDGTPCNVNAQSGEDVILSNPLGYSNKPSGSNYKIINGMLYCNVANQFGLWAPNGETITIPAGESRFLDYRLVIVL